MKSWRLVLGFLGMGVVAAACSVKSTSTDDDTSVGVGGSGSATATTTTSAGPTTTSAGPTTTSTSSGVSCDTGAMAATDSAECQSCQQCAAQGACSDKVATYQAEPSAADWEMCVFGDDAMNPGCPDDDMATMDVNEFEVCLDGCAMKYPGVQELYIDILSCVICAECPNNCDAASVCM